MHIQNALPRSGEPSAAQPLSAAASPQEVVSGLRIAHLIETDGPGGAERMFAHLATQMQENGAENVAFLPADREGWLAQQLAGSGVDVEYYQLDRPVSPSCVRSLVAAFRRHRVDLAHSHEFSMAVYGAFAARWCRIPHLITMHGSRYYAQRLQRRFALRQAVLHSRATIAVSEQLRRSLISDLRLTADRVHKVPNGVPFKAVTSSRVREDLSVPSEDRLIVSVGNLYPVKGHRFLVEAAARLDSDIGAVHVVIAGRGEQENALRELASSLGFGGRLHLLGLRSDIPDILAAADVFVLPSLSEALPLALLEAMFAGCPIVASDVGEIKAVLADGEAGLLVPPGDPAALASAIEQILAHRELARRLGTSARERAAQEYDIGRMVARYADLYRQALGAHAERATMLPSIRRRSRPAPDEHLPILTSKPATRQ